MSIDWIEFLDKLSLYIVLWSFGLLIGHIAAHFVLQKRIRRMNNLPKTSVPVHVMTDERRQEIVRNESKMTESEYQQGYHLCPEWDFMLIGPFDPEWSVCSCETWKK